MNVTEPLLIENSYYHHTNDNNTSMFRCYIYLPFYVIDRYSQLNFTFIAIVDMVVAIPAILLNIMFLYTVYKHSKFRKTVTNCLFINLSVLGLLTALIHLPAHVVQMIMLPRATPKCDLFTFNDCASYTVSTLSFVTLIFITIDTYCGVIKPFFYLNHFTRFKVMASLWAVCSVFIILSVLSCSWDLFTVYTIIVCIVVIAGVFFFVFTYAHIYFTVLRMHHRICCASIQSEMSSSGTEKTMRTSVLIVLAFLSSYLPTGVYAVLQAVELENVFLRTYVFHWVYMIRLTGCLFNAVLYYWRLEDLRTATMKLLPSYCCLRQRTKVDYRAKEESYFQNVTTMPDEMPQP